MGYPHSRLRHCATVCLIAGAAAQEARPRVTLASLVGEMADLQRLARLPDPAYTTVQFSSSDRRTTAPDQPGWFANADGFGQEPVPGFAAVLRAPDEHGVGEYLVCDVDGPGAIVRGWSAGMDGALHVWLDDAKTPLFAGKGYEFFARRTTHLVPDLPSVLPSQMRAVLEPQQDADYLPIPFAQRLRITWTGSLSWPHFYQLQVRRYAAGTAVATFAPAQQAIMLRDGFTPGDEWLLSDLFARRMGMPRSATPFVAPAGGSWQHLVETSAPAAIRRLELQIRAEDPIAALRGTLLRIRCDDSPVPQVEAPLGDFFGSFPGLSPHDALPLEVHADGRLVSLWVMPFRARWQLELHNHTGLELGGDLEVVQVPLADGFDDRTMYFHALWRRDPALHARAGKAPIDLPYLFALGQGRLVGLGCQLVNPPMHPSWRSNWWGEGDEKLFIDGELTTLGTGSEDYFNYSWSHWRGFMHPYCGQPSSTGPGNCGYVANHRLQLVDDLPFAQSLAALMELWTHREVVPLDYGRIAWFYARPGIVTDHRAVQPSELTVAALPPWRAEDFAPRADSHHWRPSAVQGGFSASAGTVDPQAANRWTRSGAILQWQAPPGAELTLPFSVPADGVYRLRLCCRVQRAPVHLAVAVDGERRHLGANADFVLQGGHIERFEDLVFEPIELRAGAHELTVVAVAAGTVGIDLVGWDRLPPPLASLPGAYEAELWQVTTASPGVQVELQQLGAGFSAGHQRFVKATRVGDHVAFQLPALGGKDARVVLRLVRSWDYGTLAIDWNGSRIAADVDLWCGPERRITAHELDLGRRDLSTPVTLVFTVTGHAAGNAPPHVYFGIDCLLVRD